jgi:hypothetical protein
MVLQLLRIRPSILIMYAKIDTLPHNALPCSSGLPSRKSLKADFEIEDRTRSV